MLPQSKSSFKRTINWNKYQSKVTVQERSQYLHYLVDPSFQGVYRLSVLSFENNDNGRATYRSYYLPQVETKDHNVMIDGWRIFDQPVKNSLRAYDNIWKIAAGHLDDYTTGCLLDYSYFKNYFKMIPLDLSKQQELDADQKAIQ